MFKFSAKYLPILAAHMASHDVRYYLNGISVEPLANGRGVMLVATDGSRLVAVHDETGVADRPHIVAISPATVRAVTGRRPSKKLQTQERTVQYADRGRITVIDEVGSEAFIQDGDPIIDGKFPNWRNVFPADLAPGTGDNVINNSFIAIATEQLYKLLKAEGLRASNHGVQFWHGTKNEAGAQTVLVGMERLPNVRIVLMPMRADRAPAETPSWVRLRVAVTQAEAYDLAAGLMNRLGAGAALTDYQMEKITQAAIKMSGGEIVQPTC